MQTEMGSSCLVILYCRFYFNWLNLTNLLLYTTYKRRFDSDFNCVSFASCVNILRFKNYIFHNCVSEELDSSIAQYYNNAGYRKEN